MQVYGPVFLFLARRSMAYTKPYLTIPQQLALLQSRGMQISDIEKATHALERIGYYRLSGFWHPFRRRDVQGIGAAKVVIVAPVFVHLP